MITLQRLRGVLAVGAVLAVPFLLRTSDDLLDPTGEPLVIVTPHNEPIRYEFSRAFREHERAAHGRNVRIDWRVPGGSNEITRFLSSEYAASFENLWRHQIGKPWTARVAAAFANPAVAAGDQGPDPDNEKLARRTFLASEVSSGLDLWFGSGSFEFAQHAAAGRLVDSGIVRDHPEIFNDDVVPAALGGEAYWDREGRWFGTCLAGFGICYNRDALARIGLPTPPSQFADLTESVYFGELALADPSKTGSVAKTFEMIVQQQMNERWIALASEGKSEREREERAPREGWDRAMRLIRRMGANARYFTDQASRILLDVASGDAAAGLCIDFYGRFQSEAGGAVGRTRLGFVMPVGGSSVGADSIGLLRGAPHRALARDFMEFVLSLEGQKLWNFKVGTPGGPTRYALRRLPIRPELYEKAYAPLRSDPEELPYEKARAFTYRAAWTAPIFRALSFVIRAMCVDTEEDLKDAYRALLARRFPARATALFDDVSDVDFAAVTGSIRSALASPDPRVEARLANDLVTRLRARYRRVVELSREGS